MADTKYQVWIDQDLCTGDGLCIEIAPDVFAWGDEKQGHDPYLAYVHTDGTQKAMTEAVPVPEELLGDTADAADDCPGECIFIEAA